MNISKKGWMTILILLFTLPMLAAWFAFRHGVLLPIHTTNRGTLLTPPVAIADLPMKDISGANVAEKFRGKWWLVYMTASPSDSATQKSLYYMRQIRQATGKNRDRVARAMITLGATPAVNEAFVGMNFYSLLPSNLQLLQSRISKKLALERGSFYLVDPHGNIMMFYAQDAAPKDILKDLERLLRVSQIG